MVKLRPTEDVQPLTAFRANVASFVEQVRLTHRPLILTQHGKSAAVLLGAAEYETLVDELELLRDVAVAEYLAKHRDVDVTAKLNEVFAEEPSGIDSTLRKAQSRSVSSSEW